MKPVFASELRHALSFTEALHRSLDGSRVLITGGTGFFGTWLLESWAMATDALALRRSAVVVTRDPKAFELRSPHLCHHKSIQLARGDVLGQPPVTGQFDACIHAATAASLALSVADPRLMFDTVVSGTANVLRWLEPSGDIPMLLTSSGAIYGEQPKDLTHVTEDFPGGPDPLNPAAVYGEAKRAAEMLCAVAGARGPAVKVARCFAFIGAHLPIDTHFAVGNFVRDALSGGPIIVSGDGTSRRSYLDASDLVIWLWTILMAGERGRAYNVGSDEAVSIGELAHLVALAAGDLPVRIRGVADPRVPASRYVPSVKRARNELGLEVRVPLNRALAKMLTWHRQDSAD